MFGRSIKVDGDDNCAPIIIVNKKYLKKLLVWYVVVSIEISLDPNNWTFTLNLQRQAQAILENNLKKQFPGAWDYAFLKVSFRSRTGD